jgi:hypothetical protein
LTDAHGDGADVGLANLGGALFEGTGEEEDGIDAAHLGIDGDGLGTRGGDVHERAAAAQGAGEGYGLGERVGDEGAAELVAAALQEGEGGLGQAGLLQGGMDGAAEHLTGAGVGGVALHDDGAACGEGADGVGADDADGEGEIAGTEDDDGADGEEHLAHVGLRRGSTIRQGAVNAERGPGAFTDQRGEHFALTDGAATLASEAGHGEGGLRMGALEEGVAEGEDLIGEGFEEAGASLDGGEAE